MYKYKDQMYELVHTGLMKHPDTVEWIECAVYVNEAGMTFVREWGDFILKFEKVVV